MSKNEFIMILLQFSSFLLCCILYICITCTVHRTVISIEHLPIANAGFFVLLASLAFRERNNFIRLRTVSTFVTAHTFCASRDARVSYGWCLLIQG